MMLQTILYGAFVPPAIKKTRRHKMEGPIFRSYQSKGREMNSIFVWTLGDVIGLGLVGFCVIGVLALCAYVVACETIKKWRKK